jgi:4-amino-4-deoxy-L-arabinose transferase-like glycosyltransferase
MVAEWIRLGTWLAGDTPLGVRLLAPLSAALGTVALARAGRDLLGSWRAGAAAAALLNATLLFGVGSVTMTPDTPLLFFWTLTLAAIARLIATSNGLYWLPAGAMAGLAMDSKYTAILLGPALLAWLLVARGMRAWLGRWQIWAGLALALAALAGVVLWNADHGWASFAKQGGRADAWQPARAAQFLGELIGGQIGLATPLVFLLCAVGSGAATMKLRDPPHGLLAALTLIPALVFVEHALGDRVQANWPAILYPAGCLAAAGLGGAWLRLRVPAVALGGVFTLLVWAQGMASPLPLPRALDPTLMRLGGWHDLAMEVAARAASEQAAFVAADNYGLAGELALLPPLTTPVVGVEQRWTYFDLPSADGTLAGHTGLLVRSMRRADPPDSAPWSRVEKLGEIARARDGVVAETYGLYRVTGRPGSAVASAVLPRPR